MARIELDVSPEAAEAWGRFLGSTPAARLREAGVLGDWVLLGFMANVDRFLEQGRPDLPNPEPEDPVSRQAAQARRKLPKDKRRVLPMFNENEVVTAAEVSRLLGVAPDEGQSLVRAWVADGFLSPTGERDGQPTYCLGPEWVQHNLAANRPSLNVPRMPHLVRPLLFAGDKPDPAKKDK